MIMHLSTKGQVTIPQGVRDEAGIGPGSAVDIVYRDGEIVVVPTGEARTPGQRALAALRSARVKPSMSTEEIMRLTRGWGEEDEDAVHGIG